jgi:hypothetical protein
MAADPNVDPFASIGGGVYKNGGWVPAGHPDAGQASPTGAQPPAGTPGAPPDTPASVATNSYMAQAQQGTQIDRNDPNIRQQVDPYAAAQERARRNYESESAERLSARGMANSGVMDQERRYAMETAGQNTGMFEAQLVGRELQNRRAEIQTALAQLMQMGESDKTRQLQRELAEIDRQLKQAGLDLQGSLGHAELWLRDKLGTGALNVDMLRALLQNNQFGQNLGFNIADREAHWNNQALQYLF